MDPIVLGIIGLGAYMLLRKGNSPFAYKKKHGSWRAYFKSDPPSQSHVLRDNHGYYVCWDRPLHTEAEARQVAKRWMQRYG